MNKYTPSQFKEKLIFFKTKYTKNFIISNGTGYNQNGYN